MSVKKNNEATTFVYTVLEDGGGPADISGSTVRLVFQPPDGGDVIFEDATFVTNGDDGEIAFTDADKNETYAVGNWQVEAEITDAGGKVKRADVDHYRVVKILE